MTKSEEKQAKLEVLNAGLKRQIQEIALEGIKLAVVQSQLLTSNHGKERTKVMQNEMGLKRDIEGMKLVTRMFREAIKELEKKK